MPALRLYNTLTRKKEVLPANRKKIHIFVCGPTVYDYPHLGHARTYIFFDFFVKYLRGIGYDVFYLQNITDIDDKIIARAAEAGVEPEALARKFTEAYITDMKSLGVDAVDAYAPATKFIPQIVAQVRRLKKKGFAYKIENDGYYFNIKKFPDYGKLSGRTSFEANDAISRIDDSVGKINKGDFCLWKFQKTKGPSWTTKIGNGRPGWHIEDTAITEDYFGPQYEIHGGGIDLKFPHHEAEIAQQEAASGKRPFVKMWMHTGFLLNRGKKMSKSLGNFITIRDFLKNYSPEALRLMVFSSHYRQPMDYEPLHGMANPPLTLGETYENSWTKLITRLGKIFFISKKSQSQEVLPDVLQRKIDELKALFISAIEDDFNTPEAISWIWDYTGMVATRDIVSVSRETARDCYAWVTQTLASFGFSVKLPQIPKEIERLAQESEKYRISKQFIRADSLRKKIEGLGYEVDNTRLGPFVWPKR